MLRYFFHIMKGETVELADDVGIQLDDDTVLTESRRALSELMQGTDPMPAVLDGMSFKIVDELGRVVAVFDIAGLSRARNGLQTVLALIGLSAFIFGERLTQTTPEMLLQVSALGY